MAGNGDQDGEAGAGSSGLFVGRDAEWVAQIFADLQRVTSEAVDALVKDGPPQDVAAAEKNARAAGMLARTAKAVLALKDYALSRASKRGVAEDGDEMNDKQREFSDVELAGLKSEFFARLDRLVSGLERKGEAGGVDREPAARGAGGGSGVGAEASAESESSAGLASGGGLAHLGSVGRARVG
jgi:hypothetical protein